MLNGLDYLLAALVAVAALTGGGRLSLAFRFPDPYYPCLMSLRHVDCYGFNFNIVLVNRIEGNQVTIPIR